MHIRLLKQRLKLWELELTVENITAEERTKIVTQLYVLKAALAKKEAELQISAIQILLKLKIKR